MGAAILNLSRKNLVSSVFCVNYAPWALGYSQNTCSGTIPIVETMSGLNSTGYNDREKAFPERGNMI